MTIAPTPIRTGPQYEGRSVIRLVSLNSTRKEEASRACLLARLWSAASRPGLAVRVVGVRARAEPDFRDLEKSSPLPFDASYSRGAIRLPGTGLKGSLVVADRGHSALTKQRPAPQACNSKEVLSGLGCVETWASCQHRFFEPEVGFMQGRGLCRAVLGGAGRQSGVALGHF